MPNKPISTDLLVLTQGINVDIESIAPTRNFGPDPVRPAGPVPGLCALRLPA